MKIPSIVTKPINATNKFMVKGFNKFMDTGIAKGAVEMYKKEPGRFASLALLASIISKDVINCVFYTSQSWNNKDIPKENRPFVASLDLMNGIVMVGGQIATGALIDKKFIPWVQSKYTGMRVNSKTGINEIAKGNKSSSRLFHQDNVLNIAKTIIKDNTDKLKSMFNLTDDQIKQLDPQKAVKVVDKLSKTPFTGGLVIVLTTLITTGLVKRGLAYLISTPLAGNISDWIEKRSAEKDKAKEIVMTPAMIDSTIPKTEESKLVRVA